MVELFVASLERVHRLLGELHALAKLVDGLGTVVELLASFPHSLPCLS